MAVLFALHIKSFILCTISKWVHSLKINKKSGKKILLINKLNDERSKLINNFQLTFKNKSLNTTPFHVFSRFDKPHRKYHHLAERLCLCHVALQAHFSLLRIPVFKEKVKQSSLTSVARGHWASLRLLRSLFTKSLKRSVSTDWKKYNLHSGFVSRYKLN